MQRRPPKSIDDLEKSMVLTGSSKKAAPQRKQSDSDDSFDYPDGFDDGYDSEQDYSASLDEDDLSLVSEQRTTSKVAKKASSKKTTPAKQDGPAEEEKDPSDVDMSEPKGKKRSSKAQAKEPKEPKVKGPTKKELKEQALAEAKAKQDYWDAIPLFKKLTPKQ